MWKKALVAFLVLMIAGFPVLGQGGEDPDPEWTRARELVEKTLETGSFSNEMELVDALTGALHREFGREHPVVAKALYASGTAFLEGGQGLVALRLFEKLVELSTQATGRHSEQTLELLGWVAGAHGKLGQYSEAREIEQEIFETRSRQLGADHPDTLSARANLALTLWYLGDLAGAKQHQEVVLEVLIRLLGADHPDTLTARANLALTLGSLGDWLGAKQHEEVVLETRSRVLGADHPETVKARANLAGTKFAFGDLMGAQQLYEEVIDDLIRELGAEHLDTLAVKANLAVTQKSLGEPTAAKRHEEEVLDLLVRLLGAEHPDTLMAKANLALTLRYLGDLAGARQLYQEVLDARARLLGVEHPSTLMVKANLAVVLFSLGDLAGAKQRHEEVLEARARLLGADHPDTLTSKANLALTLKNLGDLDGARQLYEEVLEARSRIFGAEHPNILKVKANLAGALRSLGDLAGAKQRYEEVLETLGRILGAEHPDTLKAMHNVARILYDEGDLPAARQLFEHIIQLRREALGGDYRPSTFEEAESFFSHGAIQAELGRLDDAFASFTFSLDALEAQTLRADYSEDVKTLYKARFDAYYQAALGVALLREKPVDAFHVLERYRTQSLLTLLRWNRPNSDERTPEEYRAELAEIARDYDLITKKLYDPNLGSERREALLEEQTKLYYRRDVIQGQIIRHGQEAEGIPQPLSFEEIQNALDPGTLLLAFSVGEEASHLFVLDHRGRIEAFDLEAKANVLKSQAARFRNILHEKRNEEALLSLSSWLYDKLLGPAARRIARADRLLLLPDGPLYNLPLASLTLPAPEDPRGWQYLVERKPLHIVQSANVYAELRASRSQVRGAEATWQWVGFGDPLYPEEARGPLRGKLTADDCDPDPAAELNPWETFVELPFSRREVEGIAAQFPAGLAKTYLAADATEGQARQLPPGVPILHFASHGVMLCHAPMDSFLALSLVDVVDEAHNGLLQAWEIIDHLELDADLVVLSACVTAFGPNRGGEGLLSLSRAFQIAGARSVLASLWAVNDASTAELMIRFYRHLLDEDDPKSKDEALRAAQLELIRGGKIEVENEKGEKEMRDFSHPYHWAAFQLIGDWR